MKGNKGEWSEPYVIVKLLADGELKQGGVDSSSDDSTSYKVIAISRNEKVGEDIIDKFFDRSVLGVTIYSNGEKVNSVSIEELANYTQSIFEEISSIKGSSELGSANQEILKKLNIESVKADSSKKADIDVTVHDHYTSTKQNLGFSVKSQLGSPSTLINASKDNTNFRYKIAGNLTSNQIGEVNAIDSRFKVRDRLSKIKDLGGDIKFDKLIGESYHENLLLLDRDLDTILSECLLYHYNGITSSIEEMVSKLDEDNVLDYPEVVEISYYEFKLKRYLSESALGMMPAKSWSGEHHATGGYIIVCKDGELISYHLLRKNMFENYLLNQTKFETPSTGRHGFGVVYELDGESYINLNLQIRFKQ